MLFLAGEVNAFSVLCGILDLGVCIYGEVPTQFERIDFFLFNFCDLFMLRYLNQYLKPETFDI